MALEYDLLESKGIISFVAYVSRDVTRDVTRSATITRSLRSLVQLRSLVTSLVTSLETPSLVRYAHLFCYGYS